jgi:RNA polymerase sigma-70 factor (ECF subfamily)
VQLRSTDAAQEGWQVNVSGTAIRPVIDVKRRGTPDESGLLERIKAHDVDAFERLYRVYQPRLARFLTNLLRRPQLVEEVLDDTMMVVWQTAGSFRGTSKLSTWIFAIAYRKALKARLRWPDPVEDDHGDNQVSNDPAPDSELQRGRVHDALVTAMETLSAEQRAVVDLTYFHELGYREIAEILGCPVDTVKTRMFHARRRLRQALPGTLADWL